MATNSNQTAYTLIRYGLNAECDLEQYEVEAVSLTRADLEAHCRASEIALEPDAEQIKTWCATPETFWYVIEEAPLV